MMECAHEIIWAILLPHRKQTAIEKTSWMMHHALHVLCGLEGKVRNEMEWGGWSGVAIVDGHQEGSGRKAPNTSSGSNTRAMPLIKQKARSMCHHRP